MSSREEGTYTGMEGPQPEGGAQLWVTASTCYKKRLNITDI